MFVAYAINCYSIVMSRIIDIVLCLTCRVSKSSKSSVEHHYHVIQPLQVADIVIIDGKCVHVSHLFARAGIICYVACIGSVTFISYIVQVPHFISCHISCTIK